MKRGIILTTVIWLVFSCTSVEKPPQLTKPKNIKIEGIPGVMKGRSVRGLGVKITWEKVEGADGYYIKFIEEYEGEVDTLILAKTTIPVFLDLPGDPIINQASASIDRREVGVYLITPVRTIYDKTYIGEEVGVIFTKDQVVGPHRFTLYEVDAEAPAEGKYCAIRWDTSTGLAVGYSFYETTHHWDMYLTDTLEGGTLAEMKKFVSPEFEGVDAFPIPKRPPAADKWDTTYFTPASWPPSLVEWVVDSFTIFPPAPADTIFTGTGGAWKNWLVEITENQGYSIVIDGGYFIELIVRKIDSTYISFDYYFNKLKHFRRFKYPLKE